MNTSRSAPQALTRKTLEDENRRYTGRGGISEENRGLGFLPAYLDSATGNIHLSRFADGRRARSTYWTVCPSHWSWDGIPPARSLPSRAR